MTHLIGITGKARAGKDTVASMILDMYPSEGYSFALPLKMGLQAMLGLTWAHTDGELKECELEWLGKSPRQLMQTLGTEWGRVCVDENIWLTLAQRRYAMNHSLGRTLVISDVRFQNEADWIRENGKLIHVYRDGLKSVAAHSSEGGIAYDNDRDLMICNNGSIEELRATVRGIL